MAGPIYGRIVGDKLEAAFCVPFLLTADTLDRWFHFPFHRRRCGEWPNCLRGHGDESRTVARSGRKSEVARTSEFRTGSFGAPCGDSVSFTVSQESMAERRSERPDAYGRRTSSLLVRVLESPRRNRLGNGGCSNWRIHTVGSAASSCSAHGYACVLALRSYLAERKSCKTRSDERPSPAIPTAEIKQR